MELGEHHMHTLKFSHTEDGGKLLKALSHKRSDTQTPKNHFLKASKKGRKHKSDRGDLEFNPYLQQRNNLIDRRPSEKKKVRPMDLDHSSESIRRREFNRDVEIPDP